MDTFIPRYRYKFKDELPHGDKRYILTYVKQMISEFVYNMGNLENNPFTFPEVQTLLDGITVGGHKLSDQNQILNIKLSWDYVVNLSRTNSLELNKEVICDIHGKVAKDEALIVGDFRKGNIGIAGTVEYKCINYEDLEEVFKADIDKINSIDNLLEQEERNGRGSYGSLLLLSPFKKIIIKPADNLKCFPSKYLLACLN